MSDDVYVGINYGHDGGVTAVFRGEIIFYSEEERLDHIKNTASYALSYHKCHHFLIDFISKIRESEGYTPRIKVYVTMVTNGIRGVPFRPSGTSSQMISADTARESLFMYINEVICTAYSPLSMKQFDFGITEHHESHSTLAFYRSGFDDALCLTLDGGGTGYQTQGWLLKEYATITYRNYDDVEYLERQGKLMGRLDADLLEKKPEYITIPHARYQNEVRGRWSYGFWFSQVSGLIVGDRMGAGKVMGLAAYGKPNHLIDDLQLFEGHIPATDSPEILDHFKELLKRKKITPEDIAYKVQYDTQKAVIEYVKRAISIKPNVKNICCCGGTFYNIINNKKLIDEFPDINFYFEPMAGDAGVATGCALFQYYTNTKDKTKRPVKTLYVGTQADYHRDLKEGEREYKVTPQEVAQLIADRNVVAIYQGKSEAGPRALGNRSILYDPRDPNGRDRVNEIKKREKYRPFAGSVLEEHAHEWFDMGKIKSSPYMMIAFECFKDKQDIVPALQHEDNTSRIQTVNSEQNKHYYNLINEFHKITGIPMVLNTSFNLAGDTMVDNMRDALKTCREGNIPYLYCPEREMIIDFTGK